MKREVRKECGNNATIDPVCEMLHVIIQGQLQANLSYNKDRLDCVEISII